MVNENLVGRINENNLGRNSIESLVPSKFVNDIKEELRENGFNIDSYNKVVSYYNKQDRISEYGGISADEVISKYERIEYNNIIEYISNNYVKKEKAA